MQSILRLFFTEMPYAVIGKAFIEPLKGFKHLW